jgi:hypothetical protein
VTNTMIDPYGRSSEERKALRAKLDALNVEAKENWDNPQWRNVMAQEMTETIYEGFTHENLLGYMTTVENTSFDGRVFIKEVRGLRAFWVARGGYIEASDLKAEVIEMQRDTLGFHVWEFEDKLQTSFAETQATLIERGIERLDAEINNRFLSTLQAAIPSSSDYYINDSGLSLTALNTAMREVRDSSRSFDIAIVGRSTMTDQIIDQLLGTGNNGAGFIPETNEQMVQRGVLGTYRGAKIITLTNWQDAEGVSYFPANELFVIARDASKVANFGTLMSKNYVEQDNWYWHYLARLDNGVLVHRPERVRRIVDDAQPA